MINHLKEPHSLTDVLALRDQRAELIQRLKWGGIAGIIAMIVFATPLWVITLMLVGLLSGPMIVKWLDERDAWGTRYMLLSILLVTQLFHTLEHFVQWFQFHVLGISAARANGLISILDGEIVHFSWNMIVWVIITMLLVVGLRRSRWGWALWLFATAHTIEHTYMFWNYLQSGTQRLPGILGKGGWLARNAEDFAPAQFICSIAPSLKTAIRLDVHFWWNAGEIVLLLIAGHIAVKHGLLEPRITTTNLHE